MAEQNIWKRQAMQNRMKAEGINKPPSPTNKADSPINSFIKNNNNSGSTPPWVKNNPPNASSTQPPWMNNRNTTPIDTSSPPSATSISKSPPKNTPNTQNETNNQPPWARNSVVNQPSWVKNTAPRQPSGGESNQPPWAKNNQNSPAQPPWARKSQDTISQRSQAQKVEQKPESPRPTTSNQPPWAKKSDNSPKKNSEQIQPPWARKSQDTISQQHSSNINTEEKSEPPRQSTSNQPPWAKKSDSSPRIASGEVPSWMKDKPIKTENNQLNNSNWKLQQSFEIEKKKQSLEEEIRRQEEEERQKRRLQKEKRQKEKEEINMRMEQDLMIKQDELSSLRQKKDMEEEQKMREIQEEEKRILQQERRKEEEERRRMEEQKKMQEERLRAVAKQNEKKEKERLAQLDRTSKSQQEKGRKGSQRGRRKKQMMQNSKISHISSIKGAQNINIVNDPDQSQTENTYHKYLRLINQETMESDYKKKIELQKNLYQLQLQCRKQCQNQIESLFQNKKVTNRKRKYIYSNSMQIQYGLCEGQKGGSGLQFIQEEVNELKVKFLQYQMLTKCVMSLMKKKINVHLRVPIMNYAEYKGVSFLVEHVCQEIIDIIEIQIGLFQEIANQVLVFEKELELSIDEQVDFNPISKDQLMVKKITIETEDYYILYLKGQNKPNKIKNQKNSSKSLSKMLPKFSNLNDITILEYLIGQNTLLPYFQPQIEVTKDIYDHLSKVASPALKNILSNFCLAKAINTVYSSCQGEVQQQSFFKLILQGNKEIWDMVIAAGTPDRDIPKPMTLAVLQRISSVGFNFSSKMYSSRYKKLIKYVKPSVYIQRYDYQLLEFIKNIEKYIAEDKEELVQQSMTLSHQLWDDIQEGQKENIFNFIKLKNEVSYLLYKQKDSQALTMIEKALQEVGTMTLQCIPLYLLSIKIYVAKDLEVPMLKALSDLLPILQFYFGQESMLHALVYTAVGIYYSKKTQQSEIARIQKVVTFYEHSFKIILKRYGEKSQQIADIYLSRASAFINLGKYDLFTKDIQNALKIFKTHSKSGPKIAQCNHLMGRVKCLEGDIIGGIELMEQSSNQYMKMCNHIQSLYILFEILPFLEDKEPQLQPKIEKIVEICFTYKSIWAFKRISTLILDRQLNCYTSLNIRNLQELYHPLDQDDRNNEEVLVDLEEEIKGFTSFIEIVRWALSIIAGKLAARREVTGDYEKAHDIIREVFHFYGKNQSMSMDLKDSQLL